MANNNSKSAIKHVLCPTDLSLNSQKTLGFAARLCDDLSAQLTAVHILKAQWFTPSIDLNENHSEIEDEMKQPILACSRHGDSNLKWRTSVIENSFDPSRDILNLAKETNVDLIVMKARPGIMSAFRFGSIVERVVAGSACPVLIFPTRYLANREPDVDGINFEQILFDYDFSQATDDLYRLVRSMSEGLSAELHVLSVLEPPSEGVPEFAGVGENMDVLGRVVSKKLERVVASGGPRRSPVQAAVKWGERAQTVLNYAADHKIDLLCSTLSPPHFSYEKFYSVYLGQLLNSAQCPILVKQSV
jgi:nucleotide-binding universal stress UspA family protein